MAVATGAPILTNPWFALAAWLLSYAADYRPDGKALVSQVEAEALAKGY